MPRYWMYGEIYGWPTKRRMVEILRNAGLRASEGKYSIKIMDCEEFSIEQYEFKNERGLSFPCFEAWADTAERMIADAERVSLALSQAKIPHHFQVLEWKNETVLRVFEYGDSR